LDSQTVVRPNVASFEQILQKGKKDPISWEEASALFRATEGNVERTLDLFRTASKVRDEERGTTFKIVGGIASILTCKLSPMCSYCGYFLGGRYGLTTEEILEGAKYIEDQGIRDFHLSGGTTLGSEGKEVVDIVRAIRKMSQKSLLSVNVGAALSQESVIELKGLGGLSYITCAFETVNQELYKEVKKGDSFDAKQHLAEMTRSLDIGLGSGLMAGLGSGPFRFDDYVNFYFHLKQFDNLKIVYVSRFNPVPQTRMQNHPECSLYEAARVVAVMRLVLRNIDIRMANGWGYNEIPLWVMSGGGIQVIGVHVSRSHRAKNRSQNSPESAPTGMEFNNVIDISTKYLKEAGMSVTF